MATIVLNENDKKNFKLILVVFLAVITVLVAYAVLRWTATRTAETASTAVQKSVAGAKTAKESFSEANAEAFLRKEFRRNFPGSTVTYLQNVTYQEGLTFFDEKGWTLPDKIQEFSNRPNTYFYLFELKLPEGGTRLGLIPVYQDDGWKTINLDEGSQ